MTIITLLDVKTKKKVIVRSVIDPIARIDKKGNIQIIQIHKWLYDESGDFVDEDLYEGTQQWRSWNIHNFAVYDH